MQSKPVQYLSPAQYRETVAWLIWPIFIFGFVFLYLWGVAQGFPIELWVIAVTIINFVAILLAEQALPRNQTMNYLRDDQSWNDIGHG